MNTVLTKLSNGIRVVTCSMPQVESVAVAVCAGVGGRHESAEQSGISHFIEHMLFKGTPRRSARRIMQEIEGIGGDINANTSEERTTYYAVAPADHLERATAVLADLYQNARFDSRDIELERGVIAEEIQMYRDDPSQHVFDLLNQVYWQDHPLGRSITGTQETIADFGRKEFHRHLQQHYQGANTVISAAGRVDAQAFASLAERCFGGLPEGKAPGSPLPAPRPGLRPRVLVEDRDTQQTQLAIGLPAPGARDPQRFAMHLLHVILGGNGSSRLFQELREKRGYCYTVSTYPSMLLDAGVLSLSVGLDARNLPKCLGMIRKQLEKLHSEPVGRTELARAKRYVVGLGRMALERTSSQNSRIIQALMTFGRVPDPAEIYSAIEAVTAEEIQQTAAKFLKLKSARVAVIGPGVNPDQTLQQLLN